MPTEGVLLLEEDDFTRYVLLNVLEQFQARQKIKEGAYVRGIIPLVNKRTREREVGGAKANTGEIIDLSA